MGWKNKGPGSNRVPDCSFRRFRIFTIGKNLQQGTFKFPAAGRSILAAHLFSLLSKNFPAGNERKRLLGMAVHVAGRMADLAGKAVFPAVGKSVVRQAIKTGPLLLQHHLFNMVPPHFRIIHSRKGAAKAELSR